VIATAFLIIVGKGLNVVHPLVLKLIIDALTTGQSAYYLVIMYCVVKFAYESVNNL